MFDYFKALKRFLYSAQSWDKKFKFIFWSLVKYQWVINFERKFQQLHLTELLDSQVYLLYMFRMHSFMSKSYDDAKIIQKIALAHFEVVSEQLSATQLKAIYHYGLVIYEANLDGYDIKLSIEYDERMRFEGLMTLKLLVNEIELYYLHFVLSSDGAYIGGIQGAKGQLELNRAFTKITFGLRPQNFVYFAFTQVCYAWKQPKIYAIKNNYHVYQNESKSQNKVIFDFESFWLELGGEPFSAEWMRLPTEYIQKPLEEIINKKRSTYRKRYVLMDEVATTVQKSLEHDDSQ
ncbi:DUF535 family protein [Thiosulfativibrio zosterae]|uniref:Virulence factor n=1 Tax=Thiosulfativibrio zosterae TaxID=2675053 RepID=A0A6F8PPI8_9GAMM|nr:DUF535 family protein [Thiosulfativibrio zosterae]BBP44029.1 virulence factor [Thiosulfativibrio zosterae]